MGILTSLGLRREEPEETAPVAVPEIIENDPPEKPGALAKLRKKPPQDDQPDFFIPVLYDVPLKDQVHLMDVAPYRLNSKSKATQLVYNVKGSTITVTAPREYGLATIKDYDLVIHMISHLNHEAQKWRDGKGPKPSRKYRPNAHDILKFCRRGKGGRQSQILEDSYDRLSHSTIKIVRDDGTERLAAGGFTMIGSYVILSKSKTGKIQELEVTIPEWIYQGIVGEDKPSILTLHEDYFLLDLPLDRSLYRLARKTAGETTSSYMMANIHHRSGSTQSLKQFAYDVRNLIGDGREILNYHFHVVKGENGERLDMAYVGEPRNAQAGPGIRPLKTYIYDRARKHANGEDIYALEQEWRTWSTEKGETVDNPEAAYLNFVKKAGQRR